MVTSPSATMPSPMLSRTRARVSELMRFVAEPPAPDSAAPTVPPTEAATEPANTRDSTACWLSATTQTSAACSSTAAAPSAAGSTHRATTELPLTSATIWLAEAVSRCFHSVLSA